MDKDVSLTTLVPSLLSDLEKSCLETRAKAVYITEKTSEEMSEYAKSIVPVSKGKGAVHHLKDALTVTPSKSNDGMSAKFYVSAKKWHKYSIVHLLELGHLKPLGAGLVSARPFMIPALDKYRPILDGRIKSLLEGDA